MEALSRTRKILNELKEKFGKGYGIENLPYFVDRLYTAISALEIEVEKLKEKGGKE